MAVRRVPAEKRRRHAGDKTAMGLHTQDGRKAAKIITKRHVSALFLLYIILMPRIKTIPRLYLRYI